MKLRPRLALMQSILEKCNSIEAKMNLLLAGEKLTAADKALKAQEADEKNTTKA